MEQAWTGHYDLHGDVKDADCLIGFSFGYRGKLAVVQGLKTQTEKNRVKTEKGVQPGLSNQDLANVIAKHFSDLPKILQFEIADAYESMGGKGSDDVIRIRKHRTKGLYLNSNEVAEQAKLLMKKHGWEHALIVAHPNHMPRVEAICENLGIKTIVTGDERGAVEFDPLSSQKWTRNIDKWRGYEPLAMMYFRLKGWL